MRSLFAIAVFVLCTGARRDYALVIGANDGGAQQEKLRFAESDASSVAGVLTELGGVPEAHAHLLLQPRASEVVRVLEQLELETASEPGGIFTLFYSGHAKASALSLGGDELGLDELRQRLERLRMQVRVVVLDACQSGAFARTKGAARVQDFSFNSVERLSVEGSAVLASSSASELSQEGDQGSYFTQHVLAALRGAADINDDGRVTLEEVYAYTYPRTLEDTAKTRVGSQHVTFETTLRGQGGLPMSILDQRNRRLVLPPKMVGRLLVFRASTGALMADVRKVEGEHFAISLPLGTYRAVWRAPDHGYQCGVTITGGEEARLQSCVETKDTSVAKLAARQRTRFALELGVGFAQVRDDAYTARLVQFSYGPRVRTNARLHAQGAISWNALPFLAVFAEGLALEAGDLSRAVPLEGVPVAQGFNWASFGVGAGIRYTLWLLNDWVNPYAQVSVGPAFALSTFKDGVSAPVQEVAAGWYIHPAIGCHFLFHPRFGLFAQVDWAYAPILKNLMGEIHDGGGFFGELGVRVGL